MIAGSIELLQPEQNIGNVADSLKEFVKAVEETVIDSLDVETASILVKSLSVMVEEMIKKQSEGVDVQHIQEHLPKFVDFIVKCHGAYVTYKI